LPSTPDSAKSRSELCNCGQYSLKNNQLSRPAELRQEIFDLLFEAANIATFTPEDKVKYEFNMTTERDIRNQIRYAERKGMEKEAERVARRMLADKLPVEIIAKYSGLSEEQVRAL
jgi:uncharacterized protein (DUF433 family)